MIKIVLLLLITSLFSDAQNIRTAKISPKKIAEFRVSSENPLTIVFPFALGNQSVTGGDVTNNPTAMPAAFVIQYGNGGKTMDIKATHNDEEKKSTYMNIITADNTVYVFKLIQDDKIFDSSVTLTDGKALIGGQKSFTPQNGSALLERSTIYKLLEKGDSNLIDNSEYHEFGKQYKFTNGAVLDVKEIVKWGNPHMVVFNANLRADKTIYYDRQSWIVTIGDKPFRASIFHGSGTVQPNTINPVQIGLSDVDYTEVRNLAVKSNKYNFQVTFEEAPVEVDRTLHLLPEIGNDELLPDNAK